MKEAIQCAALTKILTWFLAQKSFRWHSCSTSTNYEPHAYLNLCSCHFHMHWVNIQ